MGQANMGICSLKAQSIVFKPDSSDSPEFFYEGYSEWQDCTKPLTITFIYKTLEFSLKNKTGISLLIPRFVIAI